MTSTVTHADVLARVARYKELKGNGLAFVDGVLPEHVKETIMLIGNGVNEDTSVAPAISSREDFSVAYTRAEPGKGAALHDHKTVEIFIPVTGNWVFRFGPTPEDIQTIELGPMDVVSMPPGIMRGFYNNSDKEEVLLVIIGGANAGKVTWDPSVIERARSAGATLDADGNLITKAK